MTDRKMTRRTALTVASSLLLAPAALAIEPQSPIVRLFTEWRGLERKNETNSQAECDANCLRMHEIENQMAAIPSSSLHELAMKFVAASFFGDVFEGDRALESLIPEMLALAGVSETAAI